MMAKGEGDFFNVMKRRVFEGKVRSANVRICGARDQGETKETRGMGTCFIGDRGEKERRDWRREGQ
jgi:hypothetical protein